MMCPTSDRFTDGIKGASGYKYVWLIFVFSLVSLIVKIWDQY
jgi:heme exporter protein D